MLYWFLWLGGIVLGADKDEDNNIAAEVENKNKKKHFLIASDKTQHT